MAKDAKFRKFSGKRYQLYSPKVFKSEAEKIKGGLKKHYSVKIVKTKGKPSIHGQTYRTYLRKKKR